MKRFLLVLLSSASFFLSINKSLLVTAERVLIHQSPGILHLRDENFEHSTQASTGGTTGSWLVWFHESTDTTGIDPETDAETGEMFIPTPNVWAERCHAVIASVNIQRNPETASRFDAKEGSSFIYFHKGKMFRYPVPGEGYKWSDLLTFCENPSAVTEAHDIPAPPSFWSHLLTKVKSDQSNMLMVGGMIMVVVTGLFVTALLGAFAGSKKNKSKDA